MKIIVDEREKEEYNRIFSSLDADAVIKFSLFGEEWRQCWFQWVWPAVYECYIRNIRWKTFEIKDPDIYLAMRNK